MYTAAPGRPVSVIDKYRVRKVLKKHCIGEHHSRSVFADLADAFPLGHIVFLFRIIFSSDLIIDILCVVDLFCNHFTIIRDWNGNIQVHTASS